uniref:ATP synthase F0 subunit 8 n=1 Tax=Typosyllis antoni TaxID=1898412 RepID=A0A1C9UZF0_9ANNE|nr:ATP synthase F0 subunit 8 [Typosyllis antoni]AOR87151.1 ATP synthase F0 subunit 8 [Typosyllis antoni]
MPHLAPMYWLLMPTILMLLIYIQMIIMYFNTPSCFPYIKSSSFKFSNWKWYNKQT